MKFLLSAGSLYFLPINKIFEIADVCKFEGIEIIWGREDHSIEKIKNLIRQHNMPVPVIHNPFSTWKIKDWPSHPGEQILHTLQIAKELNSHTIVVHVALTEEMIKWQKENILKIQEKNNIKIALENMPESYHIFAGKLPALNKLVHFIFGEIYKNSYWKSLKKILFLKDKHNYSMNKLSSLKFFPYLTLDTTHVATKGDNILEYYEQLKNTITHIHFSDFDHKEHLLPGKGKLPLKDFLKKINENNFSGTISLEVEPGAFTNPNNHNLLIKELKDTILFYKNSIQKPTI